MIDIFSRRAMDEALKQMKEPRTFLLKKFFSRVKEFDTKEIDIDTFDGKRRKAAYVKRRANSTHVETQGFTTNKYEPPYISQETVTEAEEQFNRLMGNDAYSDAEAAQTAAEQMTFDMKVLDDMITRAEEFQARQAIVDSLVEVRDIKNQKLVADITFDRKSSHADTPGVLWDAGAGSDPLADIRRWRRLIVQDAGVAATDLILGESALDAFIANEAVQNILNSRRANLAAIEQEAIELGVNFYGLVEGGIRVWSYDEWYYDEVGDAEVAMIPATAAILLSDRADLRFHYGAVKDMEGVLRKGKRMPDTWVPRRSKERIVQLQSAPLAIPVQNNSIVVGTVTS